MIGLIIHISDAQPGLVQGLKRAIDEDETIDIKVPGGIYTVTLDAIEEES